MIEIKITIDPKPRVYFDLDSTVWYSRDMYTITPYDILMFEGVMPYASRKPNLDEKIAGMMAAGLVFPSLTKEQTANLLQNHYKAFQKVIKPLVLKYRSNWAFVTISDVEAYATVLRPGIRELLTDLKNVGVDLNICTHSTKSYCMPLLDSFGLTELFTEILTREDLYAREFETVNYPSDFILIDDLDSRFLEDKFSAICAKNGSNVYDSSYMMNRHIQVNPFMGANTDVECIAILNKLTQKLAKTC